MFFDSVLDGTLAAWMAPIVPSQRVFALYLISALVISIATYVWFTYREEAQRPDGIRKGLIGYIFDKDVWLHPSARQDYLYFLVNGLVYYGIVAQLLLAAHVLYGLFGVALEAAFGPSQAFFTPSPTSAALYTLAVVLGIDLAVWSTHYLQHKVAVLWQFHQVHHSAEVLTPATVYRMHPVDLLFTGLVTIALTGLAFAGFSYLTASVPSDLSVMNVNVVLFVFYLVGYNLRHSHIWVSYPPWLSYIFISPAQHQTHHSIDEKHYDRNFGLIFAFWDWLFGTLYVPRGYERLEFGISREEPNPFGSISEIYIKPFQSAWRLVARNPARQKRVAAGLVIAALTTLYVFFQGSPVARAQEESTLPSVHLEDLTWTEVHYALDAGYNTVIVPTGGIEQNGPHVILGKHQHVVRAAAEDIAIELGRTLVAPVIAYVPEGDPEIPTGHMRWPGTISVPSETFEALLEATTKSLIAHGIDRILFIGDSRENQTPQAAVAARLSEALPNKTILHVSDYYSANNQLDWLLSQGFSSAEIGEHAALRDTSELLAVHPEGVRSEPIPAPRRSDPGYNGAPHMATSEIGEKMIALKVSAAVAQIRRNLNW